MVSSRRLRSYWFDRRYTSKWISQPKFVIRPKNFNLADICALQVPGTRIGAVCNMKVKEYYLSKTCLCCGRSFAYVNNDGSQCSLSVNASTQQKFSWPSRRNWTLLLQWNYHHIFASPPIHVLLNVFLNFETPNRIHKYNCFLAWESTAIEGFFASLAMVNENA